MWSRLERIATTENPTQRHAWGESEHGFGVYVHIYAMRFPLYLVCIASEMRSQNAYSRPTRAQAMGQRAQEERQFYIIYGAMIDMSSLRGAGQALLHQPPHTHIYI